MAEVPDPNSTPVIPPPGVPGGHLGRSPNERTTGYEGVGRAEGDAFISASPSAFLSFTPGSSPLVNSMPPFPERCERRLYCLGSLPADLRRLPCVAAFGLRHSRTPQALPNPSRLVPLLPLSGACGSRRSLIATCVRRQSRPDRGSRKRCLFAFTAAADLSSLVSAGGNHGKR
jgi:hypothetical protein